MATKKQKQPKTTDDLHRIASERSHIRIEALNADMSLLGAYTPIGVIQDFRVLLSANLSTLVLAHTGTGKSSGHIVPTILAANYTSLIVTDTKPELTQITKPHREQVSKTLVLDWSARDLTNQLRWNPLSPKCLPANSNLDRFIEAIAKALIPVNPKQDPYWSMAARSALFGFMSALVSKINEHKDYSGIPQEWHGKEASLPMLVDWIVEGRLSDPRDEESTAWIEQVVAQAKAHRLSPEALHSLLALAHQPPKQRGSVIATMSENLSIFKYRTIRETTSRSDLDFSMLRGVRDEKKGTWLPVTVYLVSNAQDNRVTGPLTTLFCDTMAAYLLTYEPGDIDSRGNHLGPYGVRFCIDDFPTLPKLHCINAIASVGRSKEVAADLTANNMHQVNLRYGPDDIRDMLSLIAVKVIYRQTEAATAHAISTITGGALSMREVASIPFGFGYLLTPGFHSTPLLVQIGYYFDDPLLKQRGDQPPAPIDDAA